MKRRSAVVAVVLILALVLQTSLFPAIAIAGFRPDLLLLVTAVVALRDGTMSGLRVGAAAGLLTDLLLTDAHLGLSVVTHVGVAYALATVRPYLTMGSPFLGPAVGFSTAVVGTLAHGALSTLLADTLADGLRLMTAAIAAGVWATLLWPVVDGLLRRTLGRFPVDTPVEAV
jgi:rod shape-determining protein MreD